MRYEPLNEDDARTAASWFGVDPEGQRRFGGFYGVHPKWWSLTSRDDFRHAWTMWDDEGPIGFLVSISTAVVLRWLSTSFRAGAVRGWDDSSPPRPSSVPGGLALTWRTQSSNRTTKPAFEPVWAAGTSTLDSTNTTEWCFGDG